MPCALRYAVVGAALTFSGCAGLHRAAPFSARVGAFSDDTVRQSAVADSDGSVRPSEEVLAAHAEPASPDLLHAVTLDEIRECVRDQTAVLIDARGPESFARGHIRGALNLPAGPPDQMAARLAELGAHLAPDQRIILYCASATCGSADMVAEYLAGQGFLNTRVYSPGWELLATAKDLR